MKIVILTPGIKTAAAIRAVNQCRDAQYYFLTNPLYQAEAWTALGIQGSAIVEQDLIQEEAETALNAKAKSWAEQWYQLTGTASALTYRDIAYGSLNTRLFRYHAVGLLKAYRLYTQLLSFYKPTEIFLLDDQTYWSRILEALAARDGITVTKLFVSQKSKDPYEKALKAKANQFGQRNILKRLVKNCVSGWHRRNLKVNENGFLFSCPLRFAKPFMADNSNLYYLREVFSFLGWSIAKRFGAQHVIPEYFGKPAAAHAAMARDFLAQLENLEADGHVPAFFNQDGFSFWPFVKQYWADLIAQEAAQVFFWIDGFYALLAQLKPRAVFVDEDVCVFNKTLIQCANLCQIPTYVMVHGIPYFDIGTLPNTAKQVLAWGPSSKNRIAAWGGKEDQILEYGAPQYRNFSRYDQEGIRAARSKELGIPKQARLITFAAFGFRTNEHPDFLGSPMRAEASAKIMRILTRALTEMHHVFLIVKLHPADKNAGFLKKQIEKLPASVKKRVLFTAAKEISRLMTASDLTVIYGSTAYLEALLLRRPVFMFDSASSRQFEIMGKDFLNLEDPESCCRRIAGILDGSAAQARLTQQEKEVQQHFYRGNAIETYALEPLLQDSKTPCALVS